MTQKTSQKEYVHLPGKKQAGVVYTGNIKRGDSLTIRKKGGCGSRPSTPVSPKGHINVSVLR